MKKRILGIAVCLLFVLFQGCTPPKTEAGQKPESTAGFETLEFQYYTLYEQDGKHYIQIDETLIPYHSSDVGVSYSVKIPQFHSVAEMRKNVFSGNLTEKECKSLIIENGMKNEFEIVDLTQIQEPQMPAGMTYESIYWYGSRCFFVTNYDYYREGVIVTTQEKFDTQFQEQHTFDKYTTLLSDERVADRNARVVGCVDHNKESKRIFYYMQDGTRIISVVEQYLLRSKSDNHVLSDTIPDQIHIFVEDGSLLYRVFFQGFDERPSVEWILSFGFPS